MLRKEKFMKLILLEKDLLQGFDCLLPVEFKNAGDIPGVVLIGATEDAGIARDESGDDSTKEKYEVCDQEGL